MDAPITYCLLIKKPLPGNIKVGRLGTYNFPRGYYVYTGSARRGIDARIKRHMVRKKRFHWHIDYLLEMGEIEEVYMFCREECEVSKEIFSMPGATLLVKKFGSSDCSCPSHLAYFGEKAPPGLNSMASGTIKKMFK